MKKIVIGIILAMMMLIASVILDAKQNVSGSSAGEFLKVGAAGSQFLKIWNGRGIYFCCK